MRVGDNSDVAYGLGADEVGTALADALRSFAAANATPMTGQLTDSRLTVLQRLGAADERVTFLEGVVSDIEDVDMAEAVTRLQQEQMALQASYQAFTQISRLNLLNYL